MSICRRLIAATAFLTASLCFAQTPGLVFIRNGDVWLMKTDGTQQMRLTTGRQAITPRLVKDWVYFVEQNRLWRFAVTPLSSPTAIANTDGVLEYDVKPDGTRVVLTYGANNNSELWTVGTDGSGRSLLYAGAQHQDYPRWGRDGYLYFGQSYIGDAYSQRIYRIAEGGGTPQALVPDYFSQYPVEGGPSGRVAFLYKAADQERTIRVMNRDGSQQTDILNAPVSLWSPLAYDYDVDVIYCQKPDGTIYRVNADGSGSTLIATIPDAHGAVGLGYGLSYFGVEPDVTRPVVVSVSATPSPLAVSTGATFAASLLDGGSSGLASASFRINGGPPNALPVAQGAAAATPSVPLAPFTQAGVYSLCAEAIDRAGNVSLTTEDSCLLLPVYDPAAGFVTGGGWIQSPAGAFRQAPSLSGKASFAFVSKYERGANVPTGQTEFQFHAGGMRFKSTVYQWLVVAGAKAQFKGAGTINGAGNYEFLLTAIDGQMNGGGGVDRFRIRISSAGGLVYDNQQGASDDADPATELGGGSIVIQTR